MRLDEVIAGGEGEVQGAQGDGAAVEITSLAYDSRAVRPGSLFFCVKGFQSDGHDFAAQAVARGAAALVVERPLGLGVPEVLVSSARAAMGPAAVRFYGDPSASLRVVGVTGTNGKTTTAFLLKALLEAADLGSSCGLLGTVKSVIGGVERAVSRTTPEAIDLQADFRAMLDGGDVACAIEVSSHALELGRAEGIHFAAAIFTNLTQDHLDFHGSMEDYFQAKRRLFDAHPGVSVVNVGDRYGRRLAQEIDRAVTFAVEGEGDYRATDLRCDIEGCRFVLHTPAGELEVALPMPGRFNVANALGALAAVHALGGDLEVLVGALERGVSVPGRMEPVDGGQDFAVLVDYAHTPDSLENVLSAARELTSTGEHGKGRVVCVFGAGGDRDRGKRPLMGEIAYALGGRSAHHLRQPTLGGPGRDHRRDLRGGCGSGRTGGRTANRVDPRPQGGDLPSDRGRHDGRCRGDRGQGPRAGPGARGCAQAAVRRCGCRPGRASRQVQHRGHLLLSAHRSADWSGQVREWNPARIAQAAGARLIAEPSPSAPSSTLGDEPGPRRVVIDSRAVARGDLFVGLRGERQDGGEYGAQALAAGAWGVLVADEHAERALAAALAGPGGAVLVHPDPLRGLQALAREWRRELGVRGAQVVAVTGSTGKTSTKDILAAVLGAQRRTVASSENLNTEIGLPLSVLAAPGDTEVLVLELAMRGAGQIAELTAIAEPDVGVIVNVGPVHLELLGSIEAIAAAKAELIAGIASGATVVIPAREPLLEPHRRADLRTVTFGEGGDVVLEEQARPGGMGVGERCRTARKERGDRR